MDSAASYELESHMFVIVHTDLVSAGEWCPPAREWRAVQRAVRAFANFRLAVIEDGYDQWVDMDDGFDWVTLAIGVTLGDVLEARTVAARANRA